MKIDRRRRRRMSGIRKPSAIARGSNLPLVGRSRLLSFYQRRVTRLAPVLPRPGLAAFLPFQTWRWVSSFAQQIFKPRYGPYPTYEGTGSTGVYAMRTARANGAVHIAIASDWGTGTQEAAQVAESMRACDPDYTIHLGDIYYVGDHTEVRENFLGEAVNAYSPVAWPKGAVGTFALPGNHEMYGGGAPYFTSVLGYCETGEGSPQLASYFALESEHWRILGLDTAYNSVGFPVLGWIPGIDQLRWVHANCRIEDSAISWLRETVRPQQRPKATVILTHHQYATAFTDEVFPRPARQLAEFFANQQVVWLFGHEHRLAIYKLRRTPGGFPAYARCIGHGGMPVECGERPGRRRGLRFYDARRDYRLGDGKGRAGWNGYVHLICSGPRLALDYLDLHNRRMFRECFTVKPDGCLRHDYENVRLAPGP
jgi:predicted phosphodiesterase